ncbi:hypothetical protein [Candidatus Nitrososphaera sp. FF02]|uniref:hypothetical protein n=1 Tax=Candidatus Nitrososphaera sp. FF02 TaxID=3398226 RepID=UPI0039ECECB6
MNFKVQKRRGIGNVITTLIILIASVVLGAGVIFFGGSMFQTNTQSESIKVSNVHSWVDTDGSAATSFVVQNTGSKAVTINSINLRGVSVQQSLWNYVITDETDALQTELKPYYTILAVSTAMEADFPTVLAADWDSGASISLGQGEAAIVYLIDDGTLFPGNIKPIDAGNTYSLQIQAGQATAVQQVQVITSAPAA